MPDDIPEDPWYTWTVTIEVRVRAATEADARTAALWTAPARATSMRVVTIEKEPA